MRIAITGIGLISAIGLDRAETLTSLLAERSGIRAEEAAGVMGLPMGRVKLTNGQLRERLGIDSSEAISRCALLGIAAAREALGDAPATAGRVLISGTTVGGMDTTERLWNDWQKGGHLDYIPQHEAGETTHKIAGHIGGFAYTATPSTACSSALNAVITGANMLRTGKAKQALVGGTECLSRFHINGFNTLMILDSKPCRPFSADRAGLNLGEGAGYLLLENEEDALARNATIYGYIAGYANACDAFHQTASSPDGEGDYRAMKQALEMANVTPGQVDYINAHGTGTPNNDQSESTAIRRLFGDNIPAVSSTKPFTGHTTSASGSIEAAICLLCMQQGFVPANLHFTGTGEGLVMPVRHTEHQALNYVLCNAFGFGGNDSSLLLSKRPCELPAVALNETQITIHEMPREVDYKQWITPMEARRMSPQLRNVVALALSAMQTHKVDAIVCATRYGCIVNSVAFLTDLLAGGESGLKPTRFIQSTHNTPAAIIANKQHHHGYNMTYSNGRQSWDNALLDAKMQIALGAIDSALVVAFDEYDEQWDTLLQHIGERAADVARAAVVQHI